MKLLVFHQATSANCFISSEARFMKHGRWLDMTPRRSAWCSWGLLAVWLFLGSFALSEKINLWDETSAQDEAALAQLAFALKSDISPLEEQPISAVTAIVSASTLVRSSFGIRQTDPNSLNCATALRPHQQISVYRI